MGSHPPHCLALAVSNSAPSCVISNFQPALPGFFALSPCRWSSLAGKTHCVIERTHTVSSATQYPTPDAHPHGKCNALWGPVCIKGEVNPEGDHSIKFCKQLLPMLFPMGRVKQRLHWLRGGAKLSAVIPLWVCLCVRGRAGESLCKLTPLCSWEINVC